VTLERVDVHRPEAAERSEPSVYLHEWLGPDPIKTPLRIDARLHESSLSKHAQVL
jgi:hypothetical protein